eukprot:5877680-Pyramimonas_sp.AAC.1
MVARAMVERSSGFFSMRRRERKVTLAIYERTTGRQKQPHTCVKGSNRQHGMRMRTKRSTLSTQGRCKHPPSR